MTPSFSSETEVDALDSLNMFQRVLLLTDGTVTDLISAFTGEAIRVAKLEQYIRVAPAPDMLQCGASSRLLRRKVLLRGRDRAYVYADSTFVFARLSEKIQHQLLTTDYPIGLMWKDERLESYREIVELRIESCAEVAVHFDLPESTLCGLRTYLVHRSGLPLGAITEKWPLCRFEADQFEGRPVRRIELPVST